MLLSEKGITLIEMFIVMAIFVIVLAIGILKFSEYVRSYYTQKEITQIYSDLMQLRYRSMTTGIPRGIRFDSPTQYTLFTFDDKNYNLVFDGIQEEKDSIVKGDLRYPLSKPSKPVVILFDDRGVARSKSWGIGTLTIYIKNESRFNCITVSATRIKMGVWNGSSCKVK